MGVGQGSDGGEAAQQRRKGARDGALHACALDAELATELLGGLPLQLLGQHIE